VIKGWRKIIMTKLIVLSLLTCFALNSQAAGNQSGELKTAMETEKATLADLTDSIKMAADSNRLTQNESQKMMVKIQLAESNWQKYATIQCSLYSDVESCLISKSKDRTNELLHLKVSILSGE
jgi:uncharacterized membrane protein YgaE (UPF0421/DUF939 family)